MLKPQFREIYTLLLCFLPSFEQGALVVQCLSLLVCWWTLAEWRWLMLTAEALWSHTHPVLRRFTYISFAPNYFWLILFHLGLSAVCYGSVYATAGTRALIRPDVFSVPAVHGVWEEWSPWSLCSFTCGRGHRTRTRMCAPPQHGGRACDGPETQTKLCNIALCPGIICLLSNSISNNKL